jgi:hypothetical protein
MNQRISRNTVSRECAALRWFAWHFVMAGLDPAIHVFGAASFEDVDARHKAGHDGRVQSKCAARHSDDPLK